jgi:tetratricopeptide (TPR) repeat protein
MLARAYDRIRPDFPKIQRHVSLLNALGEVCRETNRFAEAERHFKHALQLQHNLGSRVQKTTLAQTQAQLGFLYLHWSPKRYAEANRLLREAFTTLTQEGYTHGVKGNHRHPSWSILHEGLGRLSLHQGDLALAQQFTTEALKSRLEQGENSSKETFRLHYLLATIHAQQAQASPFQAEQHKASAASHIEAAVADFNGFYLLGVANRQTCYMFDEMAEIEADLQLPCKTEQVIPLARQVAEYHHLMPELWSERLEAAQKKMNKHRYQEAYLIYKGALELLDPTDPAQQRPLIKTLHRLATASRYTHKFELAEGHLKQALAIHTQAKSKPWERMDTETRLALVYLDWDANHPEAAPMLQDLYRRMTTDGMKDGRHQDGELCPHWADVNYGLGRIALTQNDSQSALEHFHVALTSEKEMGHDGTTNSAELRTLLAEALMQKANASPQQDEYDTLTQEAEAHMAAAIKDAKAVLKDDPQSGFVKDLLERLAEISVLQGDKHTETELRQMASRIPSSQATE